MFYCNCFPQKCLTRLLGSFAECEVTWFKNLFIQSFIKLYPVNMAEAIEANPKQYRNFNDFFTRQIRTELRPVAMAADAIISPVDGIISQYGAIKEGQIFQAKGKSYSLSSLLADDAKMISAFTNGRFITLYLAPYHYHRIHMPYQGQLQQMTYVPGKLFPVNQRSVSQTENLFARNERVINFFKTDFGSMAVIMVGALNVGSMTVKWHGQVTPPYGTRVSSWQYDDKSISRGEEIGYFKMGSTVILLFPDNGMEFEQALKAEHELKFGEIIAHL